VQEGGEGLEPLGYLNTPQEEITKFEVKTWNSNLALLSSFYFYKNLSSILDLSLRKLAFESKFEFKF
jgi:hypothetical protein